MFYMVVASIVSSLIVTLIIWSIKKNKGSIIDFVLRYDPVKMIEDRYKKED